MGFYINKDNGFEIYIQDERTESLVTLFEYCNLLFRTATLDLNMRYIDVW